MVKRWVRYGHDRLYVQASDGTRLGYLDNKTGATLLMDESFRSTFAAALDAYMAAAPLAALATPLETPTGHGSSAHHRRVQEVAQETASPDGPTWTDLAATRAGAAAREHALALRQAAPVKTFFARAFGMKTDERAWRIGADGEEAVAARLAKLGCRWKVLHAIPVGENGSDIDHVVIGPAGVFTINTKHHPRASVWVGGDAFMVNGQRVPYIRNSRFEALRAAKLLQAASGGTPVPVTGLIAVISAGKSFRVMSQPSDGGVVVVTRREVAHWLARQPVTLADEQVEGIYAVARRSTTWRTTARPCPTSRRSAGR